MNQDEPIEQWLTYLSGLGCDEEWFNSCEKLTDALASAKSVEEFAHSLGLQKGVTGYAYHSVPVALYAWLRHQNDFRQALKAALDCVGDTDTVGAMVGATTRDHITRPQPRQRARVVVGMSRIGRHGRTVARVFRCA